MNTQAFSKTSHGFFVACITALVVLTGCASKPAPATIGAVVPLEGGRYQSAVKAGDVAMALKNFTHDAELTCTKSQSSNNPFAAKPAPGKYVVVSQTTKDKAGKEIKAQNQNATAGIQAGLRYLGLESRDAVEVSTIFKCE